MNPDSIELRAIHLPEAVGWWPPAPGWWLLALLIPLVIGAIYLLVVRLTRKTALKCARQELTRLRNQHELSEYQQITALSALLRRTAISVYPRAETAGLTGMQWLALLDEVLDDAPFTQGAGTVLASAPYQNPTRLQVDLPALYHLAERWLHAVNKVKR